MKFCKQQVVQTKAPGKVIISGEYSVLFGKPAIASAILESVVTKIQFVEKSINPKIELYIPQKSYREQLLVRDLILLYRKINDRYQKFLNHKIKASDILRDKLDLSKYILGYFCALYSQNYNLSCSIESNLDISLGLGSSAGLAISLILAIVKLFNINMSTKELLKLAKNTENLQHGYSSGFDILTSYYGGIIKMHQNQLSKIRDKNQIFKHLFLIKLSPKENTSHTVEYIKQNFTAENIIWQKMQNITDKIEISITKGNILDFIQNIRENHKLLTALSIIPKKTQEIIQEIEQNGGGGKISGGSGSISERACGIILAVSNHNIIKIISKKHNFTYVPLIPNFNGAKYFSS